MRRILFPSILAAFIILGLNPPNSRAADPIEPGQEVSSFSSQTQEVALEAPAAPEKSITAIEVTGNKSISTNTIISKMKMRVGSPYQEAVASDDLKRLYLLGFFSDIKIDTTPYKDGVKVVITLSERPIIERIGFAGIVHITLKDEKLKESLKSKEGQYLDYPNLSEDVRILQKMYEKIGFSQANVEYKVEENKENGKVKIFFNIGEGHRVKIKDIRAQGNKNFSSGKILRLIKTKSAWLFNAGILKDDVIKEDMERLKAFYRHNGFTDASAAYEVKPDPVRPYLLHILIKIDEGKKYLVGTVTVSGNKDIAEKDLLARLKECVPGKVYSQEGVRVDVANMQGLYFDRGYISCVIQEATSVNTHTGHVDIAYSVVENQVAYVNKVKVKGNIKTKDIVIRRELRIHPGDKFDGEKLRRSKERLKNLGFFEDVSYDTEDTESADKKNLVVDVRESKTGAFSFGGGYSTVDSFVGFVEIEQKNFDWRNWPYFTGAGQDLRFRFSLGTVNKGYDLSFTEPWLFDYPIAFGFDAYKRTRLKDTDIGYGYDEDVSGGDLRLGRELFEYFRADLMYHYDKITISNVDDAASGELKKESGSNIISGPRLTLTYDSRDNIFDIHRGDVFAGSFDVAGGPFGGDKDFIKFFGRASHYVPLFRNSTLEFRGRVGISKAYNDSKELPIYERFFAGGADTIRGYRERKIGPIDPTSSDPLGGEALLIGNVEYTYPVFGFLKLAAFYDIGNVWAKHAKFGTGSYKAGMGLGIRMKTPIGPITLDYGFPLNIEPGQDKRGGGRLHFSASQGF